MELRRRGPPPPQAPTPRSEPTAPTVPSTPTKKPPPAIAAADGITQDVLQRLCRGLEESESGLSIPLCSINMPLSDPSFRREDPNRLRAVFAALFPDEAGDASTESSEQSSGRTRPNKRKANNDPVVLRARLEGGHYSGIGLMAYAPDHSQGLGKKGPAFPSLDLPSGQFKLGHWVYRNGYYWSNETVYPPMSSIVPQWLESGLLCTPVCQVVLHRPLFTGVECPDFQSGGTCSNDQHQSSHVQPRLEGELSLGLNLLVNKIERSGKLQWLHQGKNNFDGRMKDLLVSILSTQAPYLVKHISLDETWPETDYWQREDDRKHFFYKMPQRRISVQGLRRCVASGVYAAPSRRSELSVTWGPSAADFERLPGQLAPDDANRHLPLSTSISSLFVGARPSADKPMVRPPIGQIVTPLYDFQAQALAWMLERETSLDDNVGWALPSSYRINMTASHVKEAPKTRPKRARAGNRMSHPDLAGGFASRALYLDALSRSISLQAPTFNDKIQSGGILAEAMGLGKTLEILSLIATRPRPNNFKDESLSANMIAEMEPTSRPQPTDATLIIAPAALLGQWVAETRRHYPRAAILEFDPLCWSEYDGPAVTRANFSRALQGVDICFIAYQTLTKEYTRSRRASEHSTKILSKSPLLEVHWWRIVTDEAQLFAAKTSSSAVTSMCNELWRSNSWVCSSTPFSQPRDLLNILQFFDYEYLSEQNVFSALIQPAFGSNDCQSVRVLRSLLGKLMWRHEKDHVAEQLAMPPSVEVELKIEAQALEKAIWEREHEAARDMVRSAQASREPADPQLITELRKLISHPSLAASRGYKDSVTFAGIFRDLQGKAITELANRKLEVATLALALATQTDAHAQAPSRLKKLWRSGSPLHSREGVRAILLKAEGYCLDAIAKVDASNLRALVAAASTSNSADQRGVLRFNEALYWIRKALKLPVEEDTSWDTERCHQLTFERALFGPDKVDVTDLSIFYPVERDAGGEEDEDWLKTLLGDSYYDESKREAALQAARAGGNDEVRPVMKNRLRGLETGYRAEVQDKVWTWIPRRSFKVIETQMKAAEVHIAKEEKELSWIETRMQDAGVPLSGNPEAEDSEEAGHSGEPEECIICLEVPVIYGVLPCLHSACYGCLMTFAEKNTNKCPYCREPFQGVAAIQQAMASKLEDIGQLTDPDFGAKITALAAEINARLEKDPTTRVVVFSLWRKMLSRVYKGLFASGIDCAVFQGSADAQKAALASFGDPKGPPVLLCPMKMAEGAAGLTLTMANVAIIIEPVLNEALITQAMGRINRIGQTRPTTTIKLVAVGTIEERIEALRHKRKSEGQTALDADVDVISLKELSYLLDV